MTPDQPIRVVVVDDHPVVRDGLVGMLSGQPDITVVAQAADGRDALLQVQRHDPDVLLMDLPMPDMDGVEAISELRRRGHRARVLVLTTYDRDEDIVPAIEAGATGYLLKDTPRVDLFRALRATSRGESTLTPSVASRLMGRMRESPETLSAREIEVLKLVARGRTDRQIGRAIHVSEATVKTHLLRAYDKLGVSDRTAAVVTALERGLLELDRPDA
ncbi:MAG TPA: response regulator transcription factor [Euzebyales bacterium]|nr:response regulator transcription factor [Euzebyales bacterium]